MASCCRCKKPLNYMVILECISPKADPSTPSVEFAAIREFSFRGVGMTRKEIYSNLLTNKECFMAFLSLLKVVWAQRDYGFDKPISWWQKGRYIWVKAVGLKSWFHGRYLEINYYLLRRPEPAKSGSKAYSFYIKWWIWVGWYITQKNSYKLLL